MSYEKPDVFASITPGDVSVPIAVPSWRACLVGPHYFVQNKAEVGTTYEGVALASLSYPSLPEQKNNAGSNLKVDVDGGGAPLSTLRFDPELYIQSTSGVLVDISAVTGVGVGEDNITAIPANIYVDASGAAVQTPKASLSDGDMEAANTTAYTGTATTLSKDATNQKAGARALKCITTNATNKVVSSGMVVAPGELWKLKISLKGAHNYTVIINDVTNTAVINTDSFTGAAGYSDKEYEFTVPAGCTQINVEFKTDSDADTYYVDQCFFVYNGTDALRGDCKVSYRALYDLYTGNYLATLQADSVAELTALFGSAGLGPANPLGYAAYKAMVFGGQGVSMIAVGEVPDGQGAVSYSSGLSNEGTCYAASLDEAAEQSDIMTIVPLTFDRTVHSALASHVSSMSTLASKKERIGVIADDIPTSNIFRTGSDGLLYGEFSSATAGAFQDGDVITYSGNNYTLIVIDGVAYAPLPLDDDKLTGVDALTFTHDSTEYTDGQFFIDHDDGNASRWLLSSVTAGNWTLAGFRQVKVGDTVTIGSTITYSVTAVRSSGIVLGSASGTQAGGSSKSYSIKRYLTLDGTSSGIADKAAMATMVKEMAEAYGQENLMLMGPGWLRDSGYNFDVEGFYYAAEIAGEIASEIDPTANGGLGKGAGYPIGVNKASSFTESTTNTFRSSRYFTDAQMDIGADGGFAWIINDSPGGVVRLRHALTTLRTSNETAEVCLVAARYAGQKLIREVGAPLIQKYRIGEGLATALQPRLDGLANKMIRDLGIFGAVGFDEPTIDDNDFTAVNITGTVEHIYPLNKLLFSLKTASPQSLTVQL